MPSHPDSYVAVLAMTVLGEGVYEELINAKSGQKGGLIQ